MISLSPSSEHPTILATGTGQRAKCSHYFYFYQPTEGAKYNVCCAFHGHSKVAPEINVATIDGDGTTAGDKQNTDFSPIGQPVVVSAPAEEKSDEKDNTRRNSMPKEKRGSKDSQKGTKEKVRKNNIYIFLISNYAISQSQTFLQQTGCSVQ